MTVTRRAPSSSPEDVPSPAPGPSEPPTLAVNGTLHALRAGTTVEDLVASWCRSPDGVAVARNREVVPKSQWSLTELAAGDKVEIVSAAAGG